MNTIKTWRDIELAALHDPTLQAVVASHRQAMTREQALLVGALALANQVQILKHQNVRLISELPTGALARALTDFIPPTSSDPDPRSTP